MFSLNVPAKYSNTVYNTIRPLYIFSRLFGYSSFSATIKRPSSNKIYLTKLDQFIFIIHVLAYILCALFNFYFNVHHNSSSSKLLVGGTKAQIVFGCLGSGTMVVVEFLLRTNFWEIVESLNEFDIELLKMDKTVNNSKIKKSTDNYLKLWSLWYLICCTYTFAASTYYTQLVPLSMFVVSYALINGTFGTMTTFYSFFIVNVKVRFETLNDCLRDEGDLLNRVKVIEYNNRGASVSKIIKMAQLHDKLTDTTGSINRRFALQVLILVSAAFIFSVFCLYGLYRVWYSTFRIGYTEFLLSTIHIMWAVYYNFFVITVIWSGSSVRSEGEFTGVLIHRIINCCKDVHAIEKLCHASNFVAFIVISFNLCALKEHDLHLSLFSQQLKHQLPVATCKLFPFDWTLLFTIVGATTTYLTILIQFDSSFSGKTNVENITSSY